MYQSLYRRYRPQSLAEVVGQTHIVRVIRAAVAKNRVAHAYFFAGPRGTGKTTMARLVAKAVNCLNSNSKKLICDACDNCQAIAAGRSLDVIEIDAASNNGVEDVRALRERIQFPPQELTKKVYIIDEVHMLSTGAFNALLKTLEEPPEYAMFILATTEPHKVPITIQSRCQRLDFHRATEKQLVSHLAKIAAAESLTIEEPALELVADLAEGSFRDSLTLLERLLQEEGNVTAERTREVLGLGSEQLVRQIVAAILDGQRAAAFSLLDEAAARGVNPPYLARAMVDLIRRLMYVSLEVVKSGREFDNEQSKKTDLKGWRQLLQYWQEAIIDSRATPPIAMLPLEIAAAKWLEQVGTTAEPVTTNVVVETPTITFEGPISPEQWQAALAELTDYNHSLTKLLQQASVGQAQSGRVPVYVQYQFHADTLQQKANLDALAKALAKATQATIIPEFHVGPAPVDAIRVVLEEVAAPATAQTDLLQDAQEIFK
ncbi:MAG: DNA polymerase III subunit gamma/tau [bacterium]|nr:DNA polymerase III subunit gamma/tau [bacterium]